jgi:hypothetical protein
MTGIYGFFSMNSDRRIEWIEEPKKLESVLGKLCSEMIYPDKEAPYHGIHEL